VNLGQAITELQARGFSYLDPGRCTIMLNNAKNVFEDMRDWPWLEAVATTGTAPLTISDFRSVQYVVDLTNQNELEGIDPRDVVDLDTNVSTAGTPRFWWLDGLTTLRTYPVSTTAQISVRYSKYSPEMSASSDTPQIPVRYHPIWVDLAVVEAYKDDDRFNEAQSLMGLINLRLDEMTVLLARNEANPPSQVITGASFDW
jgi:hypothetical protein